MDAISHCIEAFCSPRKNPVADAIALDGLARGWGNIETVYANGSDLKLRKRDDALFAARRLIVSERIRRSPQLEPSAWSID